MFDELADPITTMASQRGAMALNAAWRLVVAKHRSEVPGTHRSGQRSLAAPSKASHSSTASVVWARKATGPSGSGSAASSSSRSTRRTASGATAAVPIAS